MRGGDMMAFKARLRAAEPALRRGRQVVRAYGDKPGLFALSRLTDDDGEAVTVGDLTASLEAEKPAKVEEHAPLAKGLERKADQNLTYSAPDESGEATKSGTRQATAKTKVSRNAPCPCGSGKKYKLCHGRPA